VVDCATDLLWWALAARGADHAADGFPHAVDIVLGG